MSVNYRYDKPVKTWQMESSRNPEVKYTICLWEDSSLSCNCPQWTRRAERKCPHVIAITMTMASLPNSARQSSVALAAPKRRFR